MRSPSMTALLVGLCLAAAAPATGRLLLAEGPACNKTAAAWEYKDRCEALTSYQDGWGNASAGGPGGAVPVPMPSGAMPALAEAAPGGTSGAGADGGTIGLATGGAQDIENFRKNIEANYLPLPTDLTFEGLAKDYYFDTYGDNRTACEDLFCPIYSAGASPDPLVETANSTELYLAVGLDSGMRAADFERKQLNLVVVVDVSGSMDSPFDAYYYDGPGAQPDDEKKTKMDVAKEVLAGIVDQLEPHDSLSIVLFSDGACVPKELGPMSCVDASALKAKIKVDVMATSGTNFQAGIDVGGVQLTGCEACMNANKTEVENRIIFITDAQPNAGDTSETGLLARIKALSADGIYTTLIGVGLDFNTELVEAISKVKGANYFAVHSPGEFRRRLVDEFDYAVTPLVFDLSLKVGVSGEKDTDGWHILHVYGSPNTDDLSSDGTIMKVNTLFPAPKVNGSIKGGVVLLRMKRPEKADTPLELSVSYTDREGQKYSSKRTVELPAEVADGSKPYYASTGIEKAVALARYTDLMHTWLLDQWKLVEPKQDPIVIPADYCSWFPQWYCPVPVDTWGVRSVDGGCVLDSWLVPTGCVLPPPPSIWPPLLGRWERQSEPLAVNKNARQAISDFLPYFEQTIDAVEDPDMQQEVDLMKKLVDTKR